MHRWVMSPSKLLFTAVSRVLGVPLSKKPRKTVSPLRFFLGEVMLTPRYSSMFPMPVEAFLHDSNPYAVKGNPSRKSKAAKFWYPTLLLNIDIKKSLPEEGVEWLFSRVVTKQIKNGRMDIEITILDEGGEIVALSQHVALVVGTERNMAERKNGGASKI